MPGEWREAGKPVNAPRSEETKVSLMCGQYGQWQQCCLTIIRMEITIFTSLEAIAGYLDSTAVPLTHAVDDATWVIYTVEPL